MSIAWHAIILEIQMTYSFCKSLFKTKTNLFCQLSKCLKAIKTMKTSLTHFKEFWTNLRRWVFIYRVSKLLHFIMNKTAGRNM